MRSMMVWLGVMMLTAQGMLPAQAAAAQDADAAIHSEFNKLMSAAAPNGDGATRPDEAEAERRMKATGVGLEDFIVRWAPRAGELKAGRLTLAKALTMAGRPADAVPHFRAFLATNPAEAEAEDAELALGTALLDAKDLKGASAALSAFLERRKDSKQVGVAHHYLGVARWQAGEHESALASFTEALRTAGDSPISADAALKRLELLRDMGRIDEAKLAFGVLKAAHPEAPYLLALGEQLEWIGKAAPELEDIASFVQGEATTLGALQGRVVILNFFADRYEACQAELKTLAALDAKLAGAVVLLGLTKHYQPYDRASAEVQNRALQQFLQVHGVLFRVAVASTFDNLKNYTVRGIPYTVVIGKDGRIAHLLVGGTRHNERARADFIAAVERATKAP